MATAISANCLISPEPLLEQFNCPICFNIMRDVWVTVCMHRFCEDCIKECINTNHRCPLCNRNLQQDEIQRDAHFNTLLEAINKAIKDTETQQAASFADEIIPKIGDNSMRAKLEELFRDTLVSALASHLTSENDMQRRYKRKRNEIETAYNKVVIELQEKKLPKEQYKKELDEKTAKFQQDIKALDKEIQNVQTLFIQAYKSYLLENVSNFGAVATQVFVTIWKDDTLFYGKDKQFVMQLMRPEDRMETLLPLLDGLVELRNDKIVKIGEMVLFTCISSFDDLSEQAVLRRLRNMQSDDDNDPTLLTVSRNCRPVLEHKLLRGTLVVIHGDILLESEVPKTCFIQVFNENPNQEHLVNYFECKMCGKNGQPLKWICGSCASVCHKNHGVTPLIFNNRANRAKCDCRKNTCRIYS